MWCKLSKHDQLDSVSLYLIQSAQKMNLLLPTASSGLSVAPERHCLVPLPGSTARRHEPVLAMTLAHTTTLRKGMNQNNIPGAIVHHNRDQIKEQEDSARDGDIAAELSGKTEGKTHQLTVFS